MRLLVRFLGFLFAAGTVVFLVGVAGVAGAIWHFSEDLPDYSQICVLHLFLDGSCALYA